ELAVLLGVKTQSGPEAEHPDCLLALFPEGREFSRIAQVDYRIAPEIAELKAAPWSGAPNPLSPDHHQWPEIDEVSAATERPPSPPEGLAETERFALANSSLEIGDSPLSLRRIIHARRSAVALDGHTGITRSAFFHMLSKAIPGDGQVPFATLPFRPRIDLLLKKALRVMPVWPSRATA